MAKKKLKPDVVLSIKGNDVTTHRPDAAPPLPAAHNGRDGKGRFAPGNKAGRGNPLNQRVQQIRNALLASVHPSDIQEAAAQLILQAKQGDRQAFAELLDRVLGKPAQSDLIERVERLEQAIVEQQKDELWTSEAE